MSKPRQSFQSGIERVRKAWNTLSPRRRKVIGWTGGLLAFYTIFGFLILPFIAKTVATRRLAAELNREVQIRSVRLNPYALSCSIRGLLIKDRDGEPFVSWDEVYVNMQLSSLLGKPWVLKEVSTTNTFVRAQVNKDYTFNFSDLIQKYSTNAAPPKPSKPLALRIGQLSIRGARASLTDMTPREPFRRVVGPIEITLNNFHTDPESKNPYSFMGSTDSGEVFSWSGHFFLNPVRAAGELSVANVALNKYAALYQDFVRFDIRDGVASLRGAYEFVSAAGTNALRVTNVVAALRSLKVAEDGESLLEVPGLTVSQLSGDLVNRRVEVGGLSVTGAVLNLRRERDASINVVEAARPAAGATNAPGGVLVLLQAVTNVFSLLLASTNAASAWLHELSVENCAASFHDDINTQPVSLRLDEINVSAKNLSNVPGTNFSAKASVRWNTNGIIRTEVTASLAPLLAEVGLDLQHIELQALSPYLERHVNLYVLGSKLGLDGRIKLRAEREHLPAVTFAGSCSLDDFATVDGVMAEDLVKWRRLQLEGMEANLNPPAISVAKVEIHDALARIAVETNQAINLLAAMRPANTNGSGHAAISPATGAPAAETASTTGGLGQVKGVMTDTNAVGLTNMPSLHIAMIAISNAQVQLIDRSLAPHVRASLEELNGTLTDVSSEELRRAGIRIKGKVDKTGRVEISGELNPLHRDTASELKVVFQEVDLNPTDPYAAKFLGYRLRKGKLSMDVSYEVSARQLKGRNLIQLDQLTLGDKVESPDATKLPVKLGVALLKDRSGRIELDVPVEGNLDDPQFKLGRVIWRTTLNVFTKIVTSPFAMLGSLFGGKGEEVSYQEFEPGLAELRPDARAKLDVLANSLYERPGLELEIEGHVDRVRDATALRREKLEQQLRAAKWMRLRKSEQTATPRDRVTIDAEERTRLVLAIYEKTFGKDGKSTGRMEARGLESAVIQQEKGAQALVRQATPPAKEQVTSMENELLEAMGIQESDLQELVAQRAKEVRKYLLETGKAEPERIYLSQGTGQVATNGHRVYVHLR